MTSVNVSASFVAIEASDSSTSTIIQTPTAPVLVDVITEGPQGSAGASGASTFAGLQDVDATSVQDQAVVYYNAMSAKFKVDGTNTILSLTDGGNF